MTTHDLAHRIKVGMGRKQVAIGKDTFKSLASRDDIGLVLATNDLSRNAFTKMRLQCERHNIPLLRTASAEEIGEITGYSNTRIYLLRRSFAGLRQMITDLSEEAQDE
jgi:ribosomal protein L7Ae-like RNA K-turn-binding protein